ncbi:MAG: hypothetical protein AB7P20_11490 [Rhizobiaceae bacterium]
MKSDIAGARIHMELACERLSGDDEFSAKAREALRIMIRAIDEIERREHTMIGRWKRSLNHDLAS